MERELIVYQELIKERKESNKGDWDVLNSTHKKSTGKPKAFFSSNKVRWISA